MNVVCSGTVRVRSLLTGNEWDEMVEVFEEDLEDTNGDELTPEDVARRVASAQAGHQVETLECDLS